jgi:hypothetical protein
VTAVVEVRGQAVRHHDRRQSRRLPVTAGRHLESENALRETRLPAPRHERRRRGGSRKAVVQCRRT